MTQRRLRGHSRIQEIIFEYLRSGYNPTLREIQSAYYVDDVNFDSIDQNQTIYGSIMLGRETALKRLDLDMGLLDTNQEVVHISHYEPDECMKVCQTDDYKEFHDMLIGGRFGKDVMRESEEILDQIPSFAIWFYRKMWQYAKEGACFIIPISKRRWKRSGWYVPSWFLWNIREIDQYKNTVKILRRQLTRGMTTRLALPSGTQLSEALDWTSPIKAALEDRTSWICQRCTARNLGTSENCSICGTPKPEG